MSLAGEKLKPEPTFEILWVKSIISEDVRIRD
jgi:hypothetical protein